MEGIRVPNTVNHLDGLEFRGGTQSKTMMVAGIERRFTYFIPEGLRGPAGILILAHGSYCNGDIMRTATAYAFEDAALKEGLIIVYPDSFGPYWNDGRLGRMHLAREVGVDEEEFIRRIIHYMKGVYGADEDRVYFGGFSNGGALGFLLAQRDIFRGMALWCINLPSEENRDYDITGGTPILLMNNLEDRMVSFEGGDFIGSDGRSRGRFDSTYESFMKISGIEHLPEAHEERYYRSYSAGANLLYEIKSGGHVIPHPDTIWPATLGKGSQIDSVSLVLDFFRGLDSSEEKTSQR